MVQHLQALQKLVVHVVEEAKGNFWTFWTDLLGPFFYQGLRLTLNPQQINKQGSCPLCLHNTHTIGGKFDSASAVRTVSSSWVT